MFGFIFILYFFRFFFLASSPIFFNIFFSVLFFAIRNWNNRFIHPMAPCFHLHIWRSVDFHLFFFVLSSTYSHSTGTHKTYFASKYLILSLTVSHWHRRYVFMIAHAFSHILRKKYSSIIFCMDSKCGRKCRNRYTHSAFTYITYSVSMMTTMFAHIDNRTTRMREKI